MSIADTLRVRLGDRGKVTMIAKVVVLRSVALAVNLITGLLTAAMLGPDGRAEQAALILGPQFLTCVSTLGLQASLIYNIKADPLNESSYLTAGILMCLVSGVVATAIGWFLLPAWLTLYDEDVVATGQLILLITPLSVVVPLLAASLETRNEFGLVNGSIYLQSLCTLALLVGLWWLDVLTPITSALAYIAPLFPATVFFIIMVRRILQPRISIGRQFFRRMTGYGIRFYGFELLGSLSVYLDQIFVISVLEPRIAGTYVVALSLSRALGVLNGAITTVLFPNLASLPVERIVETVALAVRVSSIITLTAAVGLSISSPFLINLLFGPEFAIAVTPLRLLLVDAVLLGSIRILYQAFHASGCPGIVTMIEAAGVTITMLAMMLVVPAHGAPGAALCVLAGSITRLVLVLAALPLVLQVSIPRLFITRQDLQWITRR
jgi:enterobacterial common antigen flippase